MKKTIILFSFVLLLVACNGATTDTSSNDNEVGETDNSEQEQQVKGENEKDPEINESISSNDDKSNTSPTTNDSNQSSDDRSVENSDDQQQDDHQEMIDLAYDIFEAQDSKDYDFLKSVLAEGTKIDEKQNIFIFENVTYPYELEFFTKDDLGKLEFRYTHEKEDGTVIVGFGAIHSGDASSFVVDYEFVNEEGEWKMKSMDINK